MFTSSGFRRNVVLPVVLCLLFVPFPTGNLWWREAFNCSHTLLFAVLAFIIYRQIKATKYFSNFFAIYFIVLLVGASLGALTELLQNFVQRDASLNDFYRDILGLLAGLCLIAVTDLKAVQHKKLVIVLLITLSGSLILTGVSPLIRLSWRYVEKYNAFPVILSFDAAWSESFIHFNRKAYPGISIIEPESDWTNYHALRLDVFSTAEKTILLTIRVHDDKHNQDFSDRFNVKLQMRPGMNRVEIPLSQIASGPDNRKLDLANIAGIGLFVSKLSDYNRLKMGDIFLE